MITIKYPVWKYIVFIMGNVFLVFVAVHAVRMIVAYPAPAEHWGSAMIFSVAFNAVALTIYMRKHGPVWKRTRGDKRRRAAKGGYRESPPLWSAPSRERRA